MGDSSLATSSAGAPGLAPPKEHPPMLISSLNALRSVRANHLESLAMTSARRSQLAACFPIMSSVSSLNEYRSPRERSMRSAARKRNSLADWPWVPRSSFKTVIFLRLVSSLYSHAQCKSRRGDGAVGFCRGFLWARARPRLGDGSEAIEVGSECAQLSTRRLHDHAFATLGRVESSSCSSLRC